MRQAIFVVCALVFAGSAGCASAPVSKTATVDLAKADALVAEGCYDCLTEARDIYAKVGVGKARPIVLPRLFETTVLLGLREKELALDPAARFDEARTLIKELPVTYTASEYLEIANAILPDGGGTPRGELASRRFTSDKVTAWRTNLGAGEGSAIFREYLTAGIECTIMPTNVAPTSGAAASQAPIRVPAQAVIQASTHLLMYRKGSCPFMSRPTMTALIEAAPRFLEAGIMLGRVRSIQPTGKEIADALNWLGAGVTKWPNSPTITYALGALHQARSDCKSALPFYDRTLALKPRHEDAHLGRLICLSYTAQHAAAIAEATGMIADKNNEGEARYWRAWNERETGQLEAARADSDRMKQILYNDRAVTLAGQIEHDQSDLGLADKDLTDGIKLNENNCIAAWYWSLVQLKREDWVKTAEGFVRAMRCYESAVLYDKSKLLEMQKAENVDEVFRAAQVAGFEAAIKEDSSQVSASAYNAAVNYARANNREKALEYCDLAAKDPDRAKQAAELRALIVK